LLAIPVVWWLVKKLWAILVVIGVGVVGLMLIGPLGLSLSPFALFLIYMAMKNEGARQQRYIDQTETYQRHQEVLTATANLQRNIDEARQQEMLRASMASWRDLHGAPGDRIGPWGI
jgi:ABC-type transport system involved in cytochrome bd biosynthesis fused ATPase/permease subunit